MESLILHLTINNTHSLNYSDTIFGCDSVEICINESNISFNWQASSINHYQSLLNQDTTYGLDYQGGKLFYIDQNIGYIIGEIESPLTVEHVPDPIYTGYNTAQWIPLVNSGYCTLATSTQIGSGPSNTQHLMSFGFIDGCLTQNHNMWNPSAACVSQQLVLNGYNDWYLPPIDELELVYHNLVVNKSKFNMWYMSGWIYTIYSKFWRL